jgi:outer membrane immunogenic protein
MKHSLVLAAVIAAFGFVSAASAADMPVKAPVYKAAPMAAPFTWTGCYIGAQIGYAWSRSDHTFDNGAPSDTSNPDGVVGGGHLGCNYQFNANFVLGVEGDIEAASVTGGDFVNLTGITSVGSSQMKSDASIRGRVGYAFDRSLLYVTGGWAFARYDFGGGPTPGPACCGYSADLNGWTLGVGWEYAFTNALSARIEYRYTDYGSESGGLPPIYPGVTMTTSTTNNAIRLGVSWKFLPM